MSDTMKKMVIAVYGNLYIGNIDTEKLHSQGGFLATATDEEIQEAIKDVYWLDVRVIRQDVRYENIQLGDDVQLCIYATGGIQVGGKMEMMSTRSSSPTLDYPTFYALQGSVLNAPINPQEVYKLLGVGKYNGMYDLTFICSNEHEKIDQWARYKPVIYFNQDTSNSANWWKGDTGLCGFDVYITTNYREIVSRTLNNQNDYKYLPPKPNIDWCRMTDFIGYDTSCVKPIRYLEDKTITVSSESRYVYIIGNSSTYANPGNFRISDLVINGIEVKDCYFCLVLLDASDNSYLAGACSQYPITDEISYLGNTGWRIYLPRDGTIQKNKQYHMIAMISTIKRAVWTVFKNGENWSGGYFAALPVDKALLTVFDYAYLGLDVDAHYIMSGGLKNGIRYEVLGNNQTSSDKDLGEINVDLYEFDERDPGVFESGIFVDHLNVDERVWIPANSTGYEIRVGGALSPDMIPGFHINKEYFIRVIGDPNLIGTFDTKVVQ